MLSTPAIYGAGSASDVATIRTANLIWNGALGAPGSVIAGGAGTGAGRLDIQAQRIEFGYGEFAQPTPSHLDRLALGFANVRPQCQRAPDRQPQGQPGGVSGAKGPMTQKRAMPTAAAA